ncbi:MAG: RdgB/HAM1 family non-canonical purine NTP pyrophosphatase [Coriobacteriales bacterium]
MKKVVAATNNAKKLEEMNRILTSLGWEVVSLRSCGSFPEPVEDADSFEGNARIKARAAHENTGLPAIADDSGLMVDALGGAPGVYSSRYAGQDATDADNNAKLLRDLEGVPAGKRTAAYACAIVFIDEDGSEHSAWGACEGEIGFEPAGQGGFGYDPYFLSADYPGLTLAQVDAQAKDAISHRGKALRDLVAQLG